MGTSMPSSMLPRQLGMMDKAVHFGVYAVLAGLVLVASSRQRVALKSLTLTVLAVVAFGAVDEWHQRFIPGRSTELADWLADSLGAVAGAGAALLLKPIWSKPAQS